MIYLFRYRAAVSYYPVYRLWAQIEYRINDCLNYGGCVLLAFSRQ